MHTWRMRAHIGLALAAVVSAHCGSTSLLDPLQNVRVPGLVPTGRAAPGQPDPAWRIRCSVLPGIQAPPCPAAGFVPATVVSQPPSSWALAQSAAWISAQANASLFGVAGGERYEYIYRVTFDLRDFDPTTVVISLEWAADDLFGGWRLNDGTFQEPARGSEQWTTLKPLVITRPLARFLPGENTLDLRVTGNGATDGLLIANIVGTGLRK